MNPKEVNPAHFLLVREGRRRCALPLVHVVETLRPLAREPVRSASPFVEGLAVVRGEPVPVVRLGRALGEAAVGPAGRWVSLRVGDRGVVLAVETVEGVDSLESCSLRALPPLLSAASEVVAALGQQDAELLLILEAARLVPEEGERG